MYLRKQPENSSPQVERDAEQSQKGVEMYVLRCPAYKIAKNTYTPYRVRSRTPSVSVCWKGVLSQTCAFSEVCLLRGVLSQSCALSELCSLRGVLSQTCASSELCSLRAVLSQRWAFSELGFLSLPEPSAARHGM